MKKGMVIILIAAVILAAAGVGILSGFHIIDNKFYAKNAESLDLRGQEITLEHYAAVKQSLPECEILWDVPFQGGRVSSDATELTVTDLEEAMEMLPHFPRLETLDASGCGDLSLLPRLMEENPELDVLFEITLDGKTYARDVREIETSSVSEEALTLIPYMTALEKVTLAENEDAANLVKLGAYCLEQGIGLEIRLADQTLTRETKELTVGQATEGQLHLLALLPGLETLHLPEPEGKAETLLALTEKLPDTAITWEKTVLGVTYDRDTQVVNLTDIVSRTENDDPTKKSAYERGMEQPVMGTREEVPSSVKWMENHPLPDKEADTQDLIAEVEGALAYLPNVEKLELCGAWLNNEAMAQFRERHREDYKVVWTVQCGSLATRTDATFFMPTKYYVEAAGFTDLDAYNLRYCEDIVAIDVGHMIVTDVEFVKYMPKLKYMDMAGSKIKDLSPFASCKNLVFLSLCYNRRIEDYSPLLECTALEDLNISVTYGDITTLLKMNWLKNLWMVECEQQDYQLARSALTSTYIGYDYKSPHDGWRELNNYFRLRDEMLMFYLD